jgi:hypothetical protein
MSSGGGEKPTSAAGDGFVLKAPAGWAATGAVADPALGAKAVALVPAGATAEDTISAARVPAARVGALTRAAGGAPTTVDLSAGQGLRYGEALYVLPTGADSLVVSCGNGAAARAACPQVAGSVDLTRGEVQPAGPSDEGARAIRDAITKLQGELKNHAFDLQRARTSTLQGNAAGDLATAYRAAARGVGAAPTGALAEPARDRLAAALKATGDGWARYSRAAKARNAGAARGAAGAIAGARGRVTKAQAALAAAGYPTGGGAS